MRKIFHRCSAILIRPNYDGLIDSLECIIGMFDQFLTYARYMDTMDERLCAAYVIIIENSWNIFFRRFRNHINFFHIFIYSIFFRTNINFSSST